MNNYEFGKHCEEVCIQYLEVIHGWRLIDRHICFQGGEIDLLMQSRVGLMMVEVKGRRSEKFGSVVEALTSQKLTRLKRARQKWTLSKGSSEPPQLVFVGMHWRGTWAIDEYMLF